jgi:glutaminyl-peptide cyclotransferase
VLAGLFEEAEKGRGGKSHVTSYPLKRSLYLAPVLVAVSVWGFAGPQVVGTRAPETDLLAFNGQRAFEDLKRLVAFGPRPPGSKALAESRAWIISQLKLAGCQVEEDNFVASTPAGDIPMTNMIARIPGARPSVVMVAGHYDTLRVNGFTFVGANDGGSSAAFLLELARILGRRKNLVTYWLVFFDGEEALEHWSETDSRYGSRHLVQKLASAGELGRVQAMILVDMIADAKLDIYRESYSTGWLSDMIFANARRLGYSKYFIDSPPEYIEDDHIPFVNAGVSAADVIDLDYGPRRSYWHTAQDTVDKCSALSLTIVGRVVVATLEELEKSPQIK